MKILIVDDERANIDELAFILKQDYAIMVAKDGETALKLARDNSPDIILLDITMPEMTGFEVLTQLKSSDDTRSIPVIFITGRDSVEDEAMGFFLGAADYIKKPFHKTIVKARVKHHLQTVAYIRTIEQMGMLDALTGIPNRRGFDNQMQTEWKRAVRDKTALSLLMIDTDRFKEYNDQYGHPEGDALLCMVVEEIRNNLRRPSDYCARWGGDEFTVLLPRTDAVGAQEVAEQIRSGVERLEIPEIDSRRVTVSIGVHTAYPHIGGLPERFLKSADEALYEAKAAGRNRVCTAKEMRVECGVF